MKLRWKLLGKIKSRLIGTAWNAADSDIDPLPPWQKVHVKTNEIEKLQAYDYKGVGAPEWIRTSQTAQRCTGNNEIDEHATGIRHRAGAGQRWTIERRESRFGFKLLA